MSGPWVSFEDNPDFLKSHDFQKGDLVEAYLYDEKGSDQGKGLWSVREVIDKTKDGIWVRGRLIAVSDADLKWWLSKGPGEPENRSFSLHFCAGQTKKCKKNRGNKAFEFHTDYWRSCNSGVVTKGQVDWFKSGPAKQDIQAEVSRLAGQVGKRAEEPDPDLLPASDEELPEVVGEGVTPPEGEGVAARLKQVRKAVTGKQDMQPAKKKKKGAPAEAVEDKPAEVGKKPPNWFGRRREEVEEESESTSSSSSSRKDKDKKGTTKKKSKKRHKKKRKRSRESRGKGDRGPFGTGSRVEFPGSVSVSSEDDAEASGVFRAAPSKSKQLQLMEYSMRKPGRLASRLLTKMRTLLAREEGALSSSGMSLTPSTATSYFLTVVVPTHQARMGRGLQREMRTVAKALDLIASGSNERAADVLGQRLKALEMMVADGSWARAQHIELLPPEGATLVEHDETVMATQEQVLENKLKGWKGKGIGKDLDQRPKGKEGKGKDKRGGKWSNKASWGTPPAEAEKEK
eukprot:Skav223208  [mRNA]  locus=scaffold2072:203972:205516:+ [translate_table: standard]